MIKISKYHDGQSQPWSNIDLLEKRVDWGLKCPRMATPARPTSATSATPAPARPTPATPASPVRPMAPTTLAEMALSHVEVKFLPKNTTSIMQPMDQERVQPSHLPICKLDWNGKDLSNLLSQMGLIWCRVTTNSLCESWNGVTEKTIVNCWRKSGLCLGPEGSWSCWSWNPWKIEWIRRREYLIRRREYLVKRREYLLPHAKWARPSEMIFGSFGAVLGEVLLGPGMGMGVMMGMGILYMRLEWQSFTVTLFSLPEGVTVTDLDCMIIVIFWSAIYGKSKFWPCTRTYDHPLLSLPTKGLHWVSLISSWHCIALLIRGCLLCGCWTSHLEEFILSQCSPSVCKLAR